MQATEKYYLEDEEENERERSERERKELLKKEAENIAIDLTLKRVRFRQYHSDRQLEKEIISLEKKWEHMRQKYERSLKEIRRFEEEKAKNDHSAEQKKRLADIDKELQELAEENERFKAEGWLSTPEKDTAEKEAQEKGEPEKKKGLFDDVQERIKGIIGREKPENEKSFSEMKDELKLAMAELIAKRVAFIDPNDPRENIIRGDRKNEEHYRQAYNKLVSGENRAFNRTIDDMGSFDDLKRIGALALTNKAGGLMLYLGDRMKEEAIHIEARADRTKEKVLNADKELVLKPQDPYFREN